MVGPPQPNSWDQNGIGVKEFIDLYIDSINLFPPASVLKSVLDQVFNVNESDPYAIELDFLAKLLMNKCNCKSEIEDDRSKSTFDLNYEDFMPTKIQEQDETIFTNIKFGPVDYPIPSTINPPQPNLDEAYLNSVSLLSLDEYKLGTRTDKSDAVTNAIDTASQAQNNQTTSTNAPLNTKFNLKPNLSADVNLKMLLALPSVLVNPLFSPKITMFYGIIYKRYYIKDPSKDLWEDRDGYYTFMEKLIELMVKEIMDYLLKKLYALIKKEIIKLIKKLIAKILSEKILGYVTQIKSILDLIKSLSGSIPPTIPQINFKKCSSVLEGIDSLFNIPNLPPGTTLPPGLSLMGMSKTGLSSTLMTQESVKNMNDQGMNTRPMPDGSPNPNVVIASSISKAVVNQLQTNARIQVSTVNAVLYGEGGGTIT